MLGGLGCLWAHGQRLNPQPGLWPVEFLESLRLRAGWAPGAMIATVPQLPFIFLSELGLARDA